MSSPSAQAHFPLKSPTFTIKAALVEEIVRIALDRAPNEACGILLPPPGDIFRFRSLHRQVIELPNRSHTPRDSYEIYGNDILLELADWLDNVDPEQYDKLVIWHTHPSGSVGPSRGDLDHKIGDFSFLVVSIDPRTHESQTTLF